MRGVELLPQYREVELTLIERNRQHWYETSANPGVLMPSVTTTLKIIDKSGALIGWARNSTRDAIRAALLNASDLEFPDIAEEGAYERWVEGRIEEGWASMFDRANRAPEEGTLAHDLIASHIREERRPDAAQLQEEHPGVAPAVLAAFAQLDELELEPIEVEYLLWHPTLGYAGTADLIAADGGGRLVVLDWKRSKGIYPEYEYQVAAYAEALAVLAGLSTPPRSVVVRLPQASGDAPEVRWTRDHDAALRVHLAAMELWKETRSYGNG